MFNRSRPVVFDPYGSRRRRRMPAWLVTALLGISIGAGGVILVQERYLPPRLSAEQSTRLRALADETERERARLESALAGATQRLSDAGATNERLAQELAAARRGAEALRSDIASLLESLPPDPRGGAVEVRAASFGHDDGALDYRVVLTRDAGREKRFTGVLQFVVAGSRGSGETSVTLEPIPLAFGAYESVEGSLRLPEGFVPRQTTVRVLDRPGGRQLGMRVLYVK